MKLRRSLALAAATAVLSPVVLMTASVAQAEENPSPSASESVTTGETEPEGGVTSTPATGTSTSAETGTSTPPAQNSTSAAPTKDATSPSASASTSASTSPSASASASASASTGPEDCDDTDPKLDKELTTGLSGLPSKIVAGSGFHGFKLNVKNSGEHAYKRVDLGVFAAAMGEDDFSDATQYLTLQYQDPTSGKWNDISVDLDDESAGYLGYTDVKAKESFSIDLRLSVDKKAPAGAGFAISIGSYVDDEGNCVYASDDDFYEFDILAAGATPGPVDDSTPKPQGGSKPLPTTKPAGNTQVVPQGHLAETGSSSALPAIALAGGAAVALGLGAVFVVRRRRTEGGNVAV
ncbi:LAETG motif-containing sortase-dependent surface protein [Streptomyces sp. SID1328]|uniref:LAETG motif-containing sortase-dependent surface protein n=1 Tax=Streptomyces sp. SID1328 TaxID=2690250 RepID=UPI001F006C3C|nr:LAETG motif-containing sortase-dependent surface protein [Streptomyces sp. SID1328]